MLQGSMNVPQKQNLQQYASNNKRGQSANPLNKSTRASQQNLNMSKHSVSKRASRQEVSRSNRDIRRPAGRQKS